MFLVNSISAERWFAYLTDNRLSNVHIPWDLFNSGRVTAASTTTDLITSSRHQCIADSCLPARTCSTQLHCNSSRKIWNNDRILQNNVNVGEPYTEVKSGSLQKEDACRMQNETMYRSTWEKTRVTLLNDTIRYYKENWQDNRMEETRRLELFCVNSSCVLA